MEIDSIFVVVNKKLLAVKYDTENQDEFKLQFSRWSDPEYLEQFFEDNKNDLHRADSPYNHITIEDAIIQTIEEASEFEEFILNVANSDNELLEDNVFQDLHKDTLTPIHIESKAYGTNNKSWLRIYAIRIAPDLYVVSGGGIKLTATMNESGALKRELRKLEETKRYLEECGLIEEDDYQYLELRFNE